MESFGVKLVLKLNKVINCLMFFFGEYFIFGYINLVLG